MERALRGALAGALATIPMTAVMVWAKRSGAMGEYPQNEIVEEGLDAADVEMKKSGVEALASISHLGFGTTMGALYGSIAPQPNSGIKASLAGVGFGLLVYAASYNGWIPALNILPEPEDDRPDRQFTMIAAHIVYGAVLGEVTSRLSGS